MRIDPPSVTSVRVFATALMGSSAAGTLFIESALRPFFTSSRLRAHHGIKDHTVVPDFLLQESSVRGIHALRPSSISGSFACSSCQMSIMRSTLFNICPPCTCSWPPEGDAAADHGPAHDPNSHATLLSLPTRSRLCRLFPDKSNASSQPSCLQRSSLNPGLSLERTSSLEDRPGRLGWIFLQSKGESLGATPASPCNLLADVGLRRRASSGSARVMVLV